MTASVKIYNLPEATTPDQLDYFPISTSDVTRKISFENLITAIDSNLRTATFSFLPDDYVNVYGVTSGSRMFHPGNSIFYSVGTGSLNLVLGSDDRLSDARTPVSHTHSLSEIDTGSIVFLLSSSLGIANGVAPLNSLNKIDPVYISTQSVLSHASQISASNLSILINPSSVQDALGKLSEAAYIYVNSASANVNGTNTVQGALAQKLSTIGGTMTGLLTLNGGLRVGTSDIWVVSNNVGVGTTTPTSKLDVAGVISNDGNINVRRLNSVNDGGGISFFRSSDNTADWKINQYSSRLRFMNLSGELACIDSSGRLGIGTSSPSAKLEVAGTSGVDGIKFPDGTLQTTAYVSGSGYQDIHRNWPTTVNDNGMYIASHTTPSYTSYEVFVIRERADYSSDTLNGDINLLPTGSIIMLSGYEAGIDRKQTTHVTSTKVFVTRSDTDNVRMAGRFFYGDITAYDQVSGAVGYFELGAGTNLATWYIPYANRDWEMYVRLKY